MDDFNLNFNLERIDVQFYIDRAGRIQKYQGDMNAEVVSMHYEIAHTHFPDCKYPNSPDDLVLMKLGWILCGSSVYGHPIIYKKPTLNQLKTLKTISSLYDKLTIEDKGFFMPYQEWLKNKMH